VIESFNRPWFGYGTGSLEYAYSKQVADNPGSVRPTDNPHNRHALVLIQFGLVGLLIYFCVYGAQLWAIKAMPAAYEYRGLALLLPLFYGLINMYDTYLWGHQLQALFAYLTAIIYRQDMWERIQSNKESG